MKGVFSIFLCAALWVALVFITMGAGLVPLGIWAFFVFRGSIRRSRGAEDKIKSVLMPSESLLFFAVQFRAFALFNRRVFLAVTDSRLITIKRGLLGGFTMQDIQWKDLVDAKIEQNVLSSICGSNLQFHHSSLAAVNLSVDGVEDKIASQMYAKAQYEEQSWEEKRRIRSIEETKAAAGGITLNTGSSEGAQSSNKMIDEINNAKRLLDVGTISDAEFQELKSKIISRG